MLEKNGLVKLVEECGELTQIAAKKMTRMDSDEHWDGEGSLSTRLEDEAADVAAAIEMLIENFNLDRERMGARAAFKLALFRKWMIEDDVSPETPTVVVPTTTAIPPHPQGDGVS